MERRALQRKFVDVNVYLPQPGRSALRCAVSDISAKGFFLKTNPVYLPRDKQLTLMFVLHPRSSRVIRIRRVSAAVVRSDSDGVGMVFCGVSERKIFRDTARQDGPDTLA